MTGNPIKEVLDHHADQIAPPRSSADLGLEAGEYLLLTAPSPGDRRLRGPAALAAAEGADRRGDLGLPLIFSIHPRTRAAARQDSASASRTGTVRLVRALRASSTSSRWSSHARCVLTDSGTVQEECCIIGVPRSPCATPPSGRRPSSAAATCSAGVGAGGDPPLPRAGCGDRGTWEPPAEYLVEEVSATVAGIVLGHCIRAGRPAAGASADRASRSVRGRRIPDPGKEWRAAHRHPDRRRLRRLPGAGGARRRPLSHLRGLRRRRRRGGLRSLGILSWGILPRSISVFFIISGFVIFLPTAARTATSVAELLRDRPGRADHARLLVEPGGGAAPA